MAFILDIINPEPNFGTPNGGSTLISLNGPWTGYNATFTVVDDTALNLGNLDTQVSSFSNTQQYGDMVGFYTHPDREVSFKLYVSATSLANLKNAVQSLQACLIEAANYSIYSGPAAYNSKLVGFPLFLKYQPDSSVDPTYLILKSGVLDLTDFNDQIRLLATTAFIQVKLKTSYAAYGDAAVIDNFVPNGSGHLGFKGWDFVDGVSPGLDNANSITPKNWQLWIQTNNNINNQNGRAYNGQSSASTNLANDWFIKSQMGLEGYWDGVASPTEDPFFFRWGSTGAVNVGSDSTYIAGASSTTSIGVYQTPGPVNNSYTYPVGTWGSNTSGTVIPAAFAYSVTDADGDIALFDSGNEVASFEAWIGSGYTSANNYRTIGLVHRYKDSSNYAYFYNRLNQAPQLVVVVGGVPTTKTFLASTYSPVSNVTYNKLKIVSVGKYTYYYLDDAYVGAYDFSLTASVLWAAAASKAGYILKKGGTPGAAATYPAGMFYTQVYGKTAFAVTPLSFTYNNNYQWLDFEYRINGTNSDTALMTVDVVRVQVSNLVGAQIPSMTQKFYFTTPGTTSYNLGSVSDGQWHRLSWPAALTGLGGSAGQLSLAVRFTSDITKTSTATVDIRKAALWNYPGTINPALITLPTTEYQHQSIESRDAMIISGLRGDTETNPRLIIYDNFYNWFYTPPPLHQKIDLGIRKQIGTPGPLVLDVNSTLVIAASNLNLSVGQNSMAVLANLTSLTPFIYADNKARAYQVKIICSTTAACGFGLMYGSDSDGRVRTPFVTVVPNAYLTELPNTGGVVTGIDCGIVTLPPYSAASLGKYSNNWNPIIFATSSTPTDTYYSIFIDKIIFTPADQVISIDTRVQVSPGFTMGNPLVVDSFLKEFSNYYLIDVNQKKPSYLNPNAPNEPIRLYPATETNQAPLIFHGNLRRPDTTTKTYSTTLRPTDGLGYGLIYCPAYAL